MQMMTTSRYMKTLSNAKLAEYLPVGGKVKDGKETSAAVSIFSKEAQAEASRRRRKHERMVKKVVGGSSHAKAA